MMKKIDAHAHVGNFGGWAGVHNTPESLLDDMNEYEIEKAILCSSDYEKNEDTLAAAKKYKDRILPLVYVNPLKSQKAIEDMD